MVNSISGTMSNEALWSQIEQKSVEDTSSRIKEQHEEAQRIQKEIEARSESSS